MEVSGQLHTLTALLPWKVGKNPQYPLDMTLSEPLRAGQDSVKKKNSSPCQESNPDHLIVQPVASLYPISLTILELILK
jgi:hypothetical protein